MRRAVARACVCVWWQWLLVLLLLLLLLLCLALELSEFVVELLAVLGVFDAAHASEENLARSIKLVCCSIQRRG